MAGVRANISISIDATLSGANDLGTPKQRVLIDEALALTGGTDSVDKANLLFSDTRTLAASATENLDLAGVLADAFGATFAAAEIVLIYVKAAAANTNSVVVGNVTNGFVGPLGATGSYAVKPGEFFLATSKSGWAVTAATADLLKILNGGAGTSVTYDVLIIGRTVAA